MMPDRLAELLLAACAEAGALQAFVLLHELAELAKDSDFTAFEASAHALVPMNARLRRAIEAVCGQVTPRKLGKALARLEGKDFASLRVDCIGSDAAGILWRVSRAKPMRAPTDPANDALMTASDHLQTLRDRA